MARRAVIHFYGERYDTALLWAEDLLRLLYGQSFSMARRPATDFLQPEDLL